MIRINTAAIMTTMADNLITGERNPIGYTEHKAVRPVAPSQQLDLTRYLRWGDPTAILIFFGTVQNTANRQQGFLVAIDTFLSQVQKARSLAGESVG